MALSGSTNFAVTRNDLIDAALRGIGAKAAGENSDATAVADAAESLNMVIKHLQGDGAHLWVVRSSSIDLTADKSSYTLGPTGDKTIDRPLSIINAVRRTSDNVDVPLRGISRKEYWELSNKTTSGAPTDFYYDPQLTNGVLYLWPVPGDTTYDLHFTYTKPFDDMDAVSNDFEFPQEWYLTLKWLLMDDLSTEYALPMGARDRIEKKAYRYREEALSFDVEQASVFITPDNEGQR